MSENQSSYRQIFKATSIFGGVQFFNIVISMIRSKFIAVLIGPAGIGIFGLLTTTISLVTSLTNFGLSTSSVKEIALANENREKDKVLEVSGVLNSLVWYTGGLGMFITLILSPLLSKLTFDNYSYTWSFVLLSVTLLLGQLTIGKDAVLQGTRKLRWLAYANIVSSSASLLITIPLYYFYGTDGIVPALIIISCSTLIITQFFFKRLGFILPVINYKDTWLKGREMLKLGFFLSLSGLIYTISSYGIRIYITRFGGLQDVGFYTAGFGIINSYVGIVFTAMATDFYPRLSGQVLDKVKFNNTVNQQGMIAIVILGPIITAFIVLANLAIIILYSKEFLPMQLMLQYGIIGVFFKAASWLLSITIVAKGDTKIFFWSELCANVYQTVLNVLGYYVWGLDGLGISFIVGYFLYFIQMYFLVKLKYDFKFEKPFVKIFIVHLIISIFAFFIIKYNFNYFIGEIIGIGALILSIIYSYRELDRILNIKEILKNYLKNRNGK